jgi:predicted DNA-binding mobile mystery protein A
MECQLNGYHMSVKRAVLRQYREMADHAAIQARALHRPSEGWLRTVRKALGMSGAQLARRVGVTRARISAAEQSELSGGITLKSMQAAAEAMGCRFVYAIVPPHSVENMVVAQARKKAEALVGTASKHMALEGQELSAEKIAAKIASLAQEFAHEMPSDFWDEK